MPIACPTATPPATTARLFNRTLVLAGLLSAVTAQSSFAENYTRVGVANLGWNNPLAWSSTGVSGQGTGVPGIADTSTIPFGVGVTVSTVEVAHAVKINGGLSITTGGRLTLVGTVVNNATIGVANSDAGVILGVNAALGSATLEGYGLLNVSSTIGSFGASPGTLINGPDHLITGEGTIAAGLNLINNGLIFTDEQIAGSGAQPLKLNADCSGNGTYAVFGLSQMIVGGSITGGTLQARRGGNPSFGLQFATSRIHDVAMRGGAYVIAGSQLTLVGNVANYGTISTGADATIGVNSAFGPATLSGEGRITLLGTRIAAIGSAGGTLTQSANNFISGAGTIENDINFVNNGFVEAGTSASSNSTLRLRAPSSGNGVYRALGTSTLSVESTITGGTVSIPAGAFLVGNGTLSTTTTLANNGTAKVEAAGTTLRLLGPTTGTGTVSVSADTTLLAGNISQSNYIISGRFELLANSPKPLTVLSSLSIGGVGVVDLHNNDLLLSYAGASLAGTIAQYKAGRIVVDAAGPHGPTYLALASASFLGKSTFAGVPVNPNDVVGMYTYAGDTNFNGQVDINDYGAVDFNFGLPVLGPYFGDVNYNGIVDINDYGFIDFNFGNGSGNPLGSSAVVAVPEPSFAASAFALAPLLLLGRRLRRR